MAKTDISQLTGWEITTDNIDSSNNTYFESLFTLGNGYLGVRGSHEEAITDAHNWPLTLIAEVFDDPDSPNPTRLAPAPNWLTINFNDGSGVFAIDKVKILSQTRTLNMKRGILERHVRYENQDGKITSIISTRITSMARPHVAAIAYSIIPENYSGEVSITSLLDGTAIYHDLMLQTDVVSTDRSGNIVSVVIRTRQTKLDIAEAARHKLISDNKEVNAEVTVQKPAGKIGLEYKFNAELGKVYTLEKVVAFDSSIKESDPLASVIAKVKEAPDYSKLEKEHINEWKEYWKDSDIKIVGDMFVQTMQRFFVFQLLQAASKNNVRLGLSASIPAKTMSGPGYNGHIFWDTEIYMLPFFSLQYPEIGKSLLMYRYDRIDTAKQNALEAGNIGARFPWESADTGIDTTPKPCMTGELELHVTADVAFGCWQHYISTGDVDFLLGPGLEIILETARYWASRAEKVEVDGGYRYEYHDVIGPDEYHEGVNNSTFNNALARWNVQKALELLDQLKRERPEVYKEQVAKHEIKDSELAQWKDVADKIKINFDPKTGLYEEFDGYFQLEGNAKTIKQADVLLMLYLLPEMRTTEIFRKNFDVYYPVTDHGSSLSPAVHVLFALDIGYKDHAYGYEVQCCSIDGTKRGGASDAGLHAASLGGGWLSVTAGFGGVRVQTDHLQIAPDLPEKWKLLEFSMLYKGLRLRFHIEHGLLRIQAEKEGNPVDLVVLGKRMQIKPGEMIQAAW